MMRHLKYLVVATFALPFASTLACGKTCQTLEIQSNTSRGSFVYDNLSTPSGKAMISRGTFDSGEMSISAGSSTAITVSGSFEDSAGSYHTVEISVTGVQPGESVPLGSDATLCLDGMTPCLSLTGKVGTSSFSTDCQTEGCALAIIGGLEGTASGPGGTLSVNLSLEQLDTWAGTVCPSTSSYGSTTEGS